MAFDESRLIFLETGKGIEYQLMLKVELRICGSYDNEHSTFVDN